MKKAARIQLVHWNESEAAPRVEALRKAGHTVIYEAFEASSLKRMKAARLDAVVIDLSRLPSHGRDVALALRSTGSTRRIPLVFVEGAKDKVIGIRKHLPDAAYTTWRGIRGALNQALVTPVADPKKPTSVLAGYSGTPLPKKLGIKEGSRVALLGAPVDFEQTLGALPPHVAIRRRSGTEADVILLFVKSQVDLDRRFQPAARMLAPGGRLWLVWPKKASGVVTDLGEAHVRAYGLERAFVDYKIAAVDATWSGLCFARRKVK